MEYTIIRASDLGEGLAHHGVKGQKWYVRNYQNSDGTLTAEGKRHYGIMDGGSRMSNWSFNRKMRKANRLKEDANQINQQTKANYYAANARLNAGYSAVANMMTKNKHVQNNSARVNHYNTVAMRSGRQAYFDMQKARREMWLSSAKGHEKAVKKYQKYCEKVIQKFENTPYSDLLKDMKTA